MGYLTDIITILILAAFAFLSFYVDDNSEWPEDYLEDSEGEHD